MVVCAVRCEPVSIPNSLLTAKITGNFSDLATLSDSSYAKTHALQQLQCRFPTQNNRENNYRIREGFAQEQGCFVSVHFSHTCLMARGRDLFSPSIYRLRRARWRARSDHGRVRVLIEQTLKLEQDLEAREVTVAGASPYPADSITTADRARALAAFIKKCELSRKVSGRRTSGHCW